ncbi:hypothetical protein B0H17DRAFT_1140284 [Mycena rosella]|uniref:Uncharacterized protein n=1 Tax=Mycena rosella TaxID=1033263 RepID=A0AAD7D630_MYCRO|nr:hypothetical protein B0H17DRAFT_1140284 [Mycena rosella]
MTPHHSRSIQAIQLSFHQANDQMRARHQGGHLSANLNRREGENTRKSIGIPAPPSPGWGPDPGPLICTHWASLRFLCTASCAEIPSCEQTVSMKGDEEQKQKATYSAARLPTPPFGRETPEEYGRVVNAKRGIRALSVSSAGVLTLERGRCRMGEGEAEVERRWAE